MANQILLGSDTLVRLRDPKDPDGAVISTATSAIARTYDEGKEHAVAAATTRLTAAVAASGTSWTVPHIVPAWIEAGDTLRLTLDDGTAHTTTVSSYTPDAATVDTIVVGTGPATGAATNRAVTLVIKAIGGVSIPVVKSRESSAFDVADAIEVETDTIGTFDTTTVLQYSDTTETEATVEATLQGTARVVKLAAGLSVAASVGRRLRRKFGSDITLTAYGYSPDLGAKLRGWRGTIPDTHDAAMVRGTRVRVEARFDGAAGLLLVKGTVVPVEA